MISSGSSSGSRLCLVCFDECCIQQGEEEEEEEECEHQVAGGDSKTDFNNKQSMSSSQVVSLKYSGPFSKFKQTPTTTLIDSLKARVFKSMCTT
jgi:hypothetical protein